MNRNLMHVALLIGGAILGFFVGRLGLTDPKLPPPQPKAVVPRNAAVDAAQKAIVTVVSSPPADASRMTVRRAMELRQNGTYILDLDIDELRERLDRRAERTSQEIMALEAGRYEAFFDGLGMSAEQKRRSLQHIQAIVKAKIEAGHALSSLAAAQADFEEKMNAALGPNFDAYVKYEAGDLSRRELQFTQEFLKARKIDYSAVDLGALQEVIKDTGCYSNDSLNSYGGPFNILQPRMGGSMAIIELEKRLVEFQYAANALSGSERFKSLPSEIQSSIVQYHLGQIEAMEEKVLLARNPEVRELVDAEERLRKLRANPSSNPATIAQFEAIISELKTKNSKVQR
jgi:hypothetical protein